MVECGCGGSKYFMMQSKRGRTALAGIPPSSALFGWRLRLHVLLVAQLPERRVHTLARNHRLIVRIRLQFLLLFFEDSGVLVTLAPLVIGRSAFGRIDTVLIGTLAAHYCLAAQFPSQSVTKHARWEDASALRYAVLREDLANLV